MVRGGFSKMNIRGGMARGVIPTFSMRRFNKNNQIDTSSFMPYRLKSRRLITSNNNNRVQTVYMFPTNAVTQRGSNNWRRGSFFMNNRRFTTFPGNQQLAQPQQPTTSNVGGGSGFYNPELYTVSEPMRRTKVGEFRRKRPGFQFNRNNRARGGFRKQNQQQQQQPQTQRNNKRRNRRRNNRAARKPTESDLNAQLDAYMGEDAAKHRLDSQLDAYFGRDLTSAENEVNKS